MRGKLSLVIVSIALLSGCSTVDQQAVYEGSCPKFFVECNDCTPSSALSIKVEMDECESSGGVWYDIYDDIDDSTYDTCIRE